MLKIILNLWKRTAKNQFNIVIIDTKRAAQQRGDLVPAAAVAVVRAAAGRDAHQVANVADSYRNIRTNVI